jgi:Tfp pilus assembly protein PilV
MCRSRPRSALRPGFSLVELVVAMTLLSVGVLGLAAAAALALRSMNSAAAMDRGTRAATTLLDSLAHVATPSAGERTEDGVRIRWSIEQDSVLTHLRAVVEVGVPAATRRVEYATSRMRPVPE